MKIAEKVSLFSIFQQNIYQTKTPTCAWHEFCFRNMMEYSLRMQSGGKNNQSCTSLYDLHKKCKGGTLHVGRNKQDT